MKIITLQELSQLYYLNKAIEMDKQRLEQLKALVEGKSSTNLSGLPLNKKDKSGNSSLEKYIAEIIDLETVIAYKISQYIYERNRLERYILNIPNYYLQSIFTLRFIDGYSWNQIAYKIGGITADAARMACKRYMQNNNEKP